MNPLGDLHRKKPLSKGMRWGSKTASMRKGKRPSLAGLWIESEWGEKQCVMYKDREIDLSRAGKNLKRQTKDFASESRC